MTYYAVNRTESLMHYGVEGMKWGIRRYENPDGTLTEEGKRRYGSPENFRNSAEYKKYQAQQSSGRVEKKPRTEKQLANDLRQKKRYKNVQTFKKASAILGATAAVTALGIMAYNHHVSKTSVDVGRAAIDRINIATIPIDKFEFDKFTYKKF